MFGAMQGLRLIKVLTLNEIKINSIFLSLYQNLPLESSTSKNNSTSLKKIGVNLNTKPVLSSQKYMILKIKHE
jgi:hypothetical protein